jgi:hypothetical protein
MQPISGGAMRNKTRAFNGVTRVSALSRFVAASGGALLCVLATRAHAQGPELAGTGLPQVRVNLFSAPSNETGFTLGDLLDNKIWNLVTYPLRLGTLDQIGARTHQVPRPGVQLELLAPAAGVTIHFRW